MPTVERVAAMIKKEGEPLILRRQGKPGPPDLPLIGFVRGYSLDELTGDLIQGDREIRISNVEIAAAGWPGPPRDGDRVLIDGKLTTVQSAETRKLRGRIAMHVLQVRGS